MRRHRSGPLARPPGTLRRKWIQRRKLLHRRDPSEQKNASLRNGRDFHWKQTKMSSWAHVNVVFVNLTDASGNKGEEVENTNGVSESRHSDWGGVKRVITAVASRRDARRGTLAQTRRGTPAERKQMANVRGAHACHHHLH